MSLVERAYALAQSGDYPSISTLRKKLKQEGFSFSEIELTLSGASLRRSLRELCRNAIDQGNVKLAQGAPDDTEGSPELAPSPRVSRFATLPLQEHEGEDHGEQ